MATMNQDELAAIIAAAQERAGWQYQPLTPKNKSITNKGDTVGRMWTESNAAWTANAPRTIIALVERIRELEAQRDALQAGEWKRVEDIPDKPDDVHYTDCELLLKFSGWYNHKYRGWSVQIPTDTPSPAFWKPLPTP